MASQDKIIFYTNRHCPWAHRAQIVLLELGIPYEEQTIDLSVPRTPEYLAVNPRGLVPAISFNGEIIIESAIVAQFLADKQPNHLVPPTGTAEGALRRAHYALFADAYVSISSKHILTLARLANEAEAEEGARVAVDEIIKHVEPLLADANPFFGGSDKLTLADVLVAPHVIRALALSKAGVIPTIFAQGLSEKAPNFIKWAAAVANHPSIKTNYDEEGIVNLGRQRIAKIRAEAAAAKSE